MCSTSRAAVSGLSAGHPTGVLTRLADVLDDLHVADLSILTSDEHKAMVIRLINAQHQLHADVLAAIAAFDAADVASTTRHRTTKRWLEQRTRVSAGTASHLTRTARALRDHLPHTQRTLMQGLISPQHVSAITAVIDKIGVDHAQVAEPILLDIARQAEPSVVRRATARIHALVDHAGAEKALHDAYERRGVTLSVVGEHAYLDGVLDVESAELLRNALQPLMSRWGEADRRSVPQMRADALVDLAKRELDSAALPEMGGERPHLSIVIDEEALRTGIGSATLPWTGATVPAATARRWACDAQLTPVLARLLPPANGGPSSPTNPIAMAIGGGWLPLDVGRSARLATSGQLKALRVRDGGCVHPGCTRTPAYCDAHHVRHWADGGSTSLQNLVLLCRHHHRTLHAGLWSIKPDTGQPGRFWAGTAGWERPAQTAADRSPPIVVHPRGRGAEVGVGVDGGRSGGSSDDSS